MRMRIIFAGLAASVAIAPLPGQVNLLPTTSWGFGPLVSGWHFTTPLATPGGAVADVAQAAMPFEFRVTPGRWSVDITGAYAVAAVHMQGADSTSNQGGGGGDHILSLAGPTDVKLRVTGPIVGDRLVLTAGVNIPTGTTRLSADQTTVLQAAGAPGLGMPVGAYGTGTGGTVGLIGVAEAAGWTLALGGSVEQRTEYTPIALAISGGSSETRLTPGTAMHASIGGDRTLGETRLSVLVLADAYGTDHVIVSAAGVESGRTQYQLGPQFAGIARLDFGGGVWSEGALTASARYRSAFTDASGTAVTGSSGTYLDGALGGVLGGGSGVGLVIGLDGRWQSGLPFTTALVGAAATVGGASLGIQAGNVRFVVHPQYGTFDTGRTRTTGVGGTIALAIFGRGAR